MSQDQRNGKRKWGELSRAERQEVADRKWGKVSDPNMRAVVQEMVDSGSGWASAMDRVFRLLGGGEK